MSGAADPIQPILPAFPEVADGVFFHNDGPAEPGVFSGSLVVRDKARYEAILRLSAEGLGVHRVARILSCSAHTVQAARRRDESYIATLKKRLAGTCREVAALSVEGLRDMLLDNPEKISARDRAWIAAVLVDKAEVLESGAAARLEAGDGAAHEGFAALLRGLRDVQAAAMRLGGENVAEKEGAADFGGGLGVPVEPGPGRLQAVGVDRGELARRAERARVVHDVECIPAPGGVSADMSSGAKA